MPPPKNVAGQPRGSPDTPAQPTSSTVNNLHGYDTRLTRQLAKPRLASLAGRWLRPGVMKMPKGGDQPLSNFETQLLLPKGFTTRTMPKSDEDLHAVEAIKWITESLPPRVNYWPALTLAFVAQVETALNELGLETDENIASNERVQSVREDGRGNAQLVLGVAPNLTVSCRPYYNAAERVIRVEMRRQHPSAPGHATGRWREFSQVIQLLGKMSPGGRSKVAHHIWQVGVLPREQIIPSGGRPRRPRPFYRIVKELDTASGSHGGALFQAMVYAYFSAESPYLNVVSNAVNVGSSRAGALGDVDGYLGEEVVLAAEAKDKSLTIEDEHDLSTFIEDVSPYPDVDAVVFARSADDEVRSWLSDMGVRTVDRGEMAAAVSLWDIPKQETAVNAMRFYLRHIQKQPALLRRVIGFLAEDESDGQHSNGT